MQYKSRGIGVAGEMFLLSEMRLLNNWLRYASL